MEFNDELKYEEMVLFKQILCKHNGSDPVILKMKDETGDVKVLTASMFWVKTSNDLSQELEKTFADRIKISIQSMDTDLKAAV